MSFKISKRTLRRRVDAAVKKQFQQIAENIREMYPSDSVSTSLGFLSSYSSSSVTDSSSADEKTGFPETPVNTEPDEATAVESQGILSTDSPVDEPSVRDALQSWAVQSHIPLVHLTSLLKIIRRLSPDLPSDARTLLGVPGNSVTLTAMGSVYLGVMRRLLNLWLRSPREKVFRHNDSQFPSNDIRLSPCASQPVSVATEENHLKKELTMDGIERGGNVNKPDGRWLLVAMEEFENAPQCEYLVPTSTSSTKSGLVWPCPRVVHSLEPPGKDSGEDLLSNVNEAYVAVVLASCLISLLEDSQPLLEMDAVSKVLEQSLDSKGTMLTCRQPPIRTLRSVQAVQVRRRHIPPPGTLEQRLFREVTKPVYKVPKLSRAEKIILKLEERDRQNLENPYRNFLVRKAKTDFYDFAEDKSMLIYQPFYCHSWEWQPIWNKLHHIGFSFRGFPVSVLREAAKNTKWQAFADHVLREPIVNKYLFGSHDPAACAKALAITSRTRFLTLIGGVIGHRIMTRDEVKTYANFGTSGGLEALHSQLVSTSSLPTSELSSKLMHHTSELVCILHQHASTKSAECDDSNGSDK
ncbi:YmL10 [Sparganum proliferum]